MFSSGKDSGNVFYFAGKKLGFTNDSGKFHNISLGQGQEKIAEKTMEIAAEQGHWVILQVSAVQLHNKALFAN